MLLVIIAIVLHSLTPVATTQLFASDLVAALIATAGFTIMIVAWRQFKVGNVAICPTEITEKLITGGIFRLTRNPMYLGIILMLVGLAVWVGTLPFYLAAFAFFTVIQWFFCPYEEEKLRRTFGDGYAEYAATVRSWI